MRSPFPPGTLLSGRIRSPSPLRHAPGRVPSHAPLRALLLALILMAVAVMALLRHEGAVLLPNLLALVLMGLIYAFVRLEPARPAARRRPLPS